MQKLLIVLLAGPLGCIAAIVLVVALLGTGRDFNDTRMATGMLLIYVIGPVGFVVGAVIGVIAVSLARDWWLFQPRILAVMLAVMALAMGGAGWALFRDRPPAPPRLDGSRLVLEVALRFRPGYAPPPPGKAWVASLYAEPPDVRAWAPVFLGLDWPRARTEDGRLVVQAAVPLDHNPTAYRFLAIHERRDTASHYLHDLGLPFAPTQTDLAWTEWRPGCEHPSCAGTLRTFDLAGIEFRTRLQRAPGR
jgi:hypothetical protein